MATVNKWKDLCFLQRASGFPYEEILMKNRNIVFESAEETREKWKRRIVKNHNQDTIIWNHDSPLMVSHAKKLLVNYVFRLRIYFLEKEQGDNWYLTTCSIDTLPWPHSYEPVGCLQETLKAVLNTKLSTQPCFVRRSQRRKKVK